MVTKSATQAVWYVLAVPPLIGLLACSVAIATGVLRWAPIFYAHDVEGTPEVLMDAVLSADLATADAAIQRGADPNALAVVTRGDLVRITGDRTTALALATARGDETMIAALIAAGATVRGPFGELASCAARRRGDEDIHQLLARYGVDDAPEDCTPNVMLEHIERTRHR